MIHVHKMEEARTVHVALRSGAEIKIEADEINHPNNELGLVRFKLKGEVVGLVLANQFAAWRTSNPQ